MGWLVIIIIINILILLMVSGLVSLIALLLHSIGVLSVGLSVVCLFQTVQPACHVFL
jgi:EamA domain-containing membrane protein RarD